MYIGIRSLIYVKLVDRSSTKVDQIFDEILSRILKLHGKLFEFDSIEKVNINVDRFIMMHPLINIPMHISDYIYGFFDRYE